MQKLPVMSSAASRFAFVIFCSLYAGLSMADMRINKAIVQFYSDDLPRQDVEVSNLSSENLYLQVEVQEVLNPGTDSQQTRRSTNVDEMKFLASPNKAIIAPGAKRKVRLVNLVEPSDEERIYRVTFRPIPPPSDENQSMVKVLIAYQTLVIVRPRDVVQEVSAERYGNELLLRNSGNSNVLLQDGRICQNADECQELPVKRLYSGTELRIALADTESDVSYVLDYGRAGQETRQF